MSQAVIRCLKTFERPLLIKCYIVIIDERTTHGKISIFDAMILLFNSSWERTRKDTLENCFRKSGQDNTFKLFTKQLPYFQ